MGPSAAARIACAAASLVAAILLLSLTGHHPGWTMSLAIFGLAVVAAVRPEDGLLVFAGLGPVITVLSVLADADNLGIHYPEAFALAFLCGAAARRAFDRTPFAAPPRVAWPSLVLIAAALASAVVQAAVLNVEQPDLRAGGTLPIVLAADYLVLQNRVTVALLFAEGLLLFLLVADLCGRAPAQRGRVLAMMIAGAAGAAALNLFRLITAAMRQEHALATLWSYFLNVRVNVQYSDWNAAASHFSMMLIVALAFASRRRVFIVPAALLSAALWVTGSRTALAAVLITGAGLVLLRPGRSTRQRALVLAAALAVVVIAGIAGWLWYPSLRNDPIAFSLRTRLVLWRAAVSMMTTNPVFGVGIGGFYELSRSYAPAMLETVIWRPHENAHNYFIQVLAELGIPGFVLFVSVIALSLRELWRRVASDDMAAACGAALAAYLLTCLTGHPLLVPDAAVPVLDDACGRRRTVRDGAGSFHVTSMGPHCDDRRHRDPRRHAAPPRSQRRRPRRPAEHGVRFLRLADRDGRTAVPLRRRGVHLLRALVRAGDPDSAESRTAGAAGERGAAVPRWAGSRSRAAAIRRRLANRAARPLPARRRRRLRAHRTAGTCGGSGGRRSSGRRAGADGGCAEDRGGRMNDGQVALPVAGERRCGITS
jgi:O-antigen ligase